MALDSSIFIYQIEANPVYVELTDDVFAWVESPGNEAVTSTITMLEILVRPYQERNAQRVSEYSGLLSAFPNLSWIDVNLNVADMAASIRASFRLRTPDALQAACAMQGGATGLITNDEVFTRVPGFETLVLDRIL